MISWYWIRLPLTPFRRPSLLNVRLYRIFKRKQHSILPHPTHLTFQQPQAIISINNIVVIIIKRARTRRQTTKHIIVRVVLWRSVILNLSSICSKLFISFRSIWCFWPLAYWSLWSNLLFSFCIFLKFIWVFSWIYLCFFIWETCSAFRKPTHTW